MTAGELRGGADVPGYRRLAQMLAAEIEAGQYGPDKPLPTDSELMLRYGLGRQTVRRAFQELVADGAVYRVRGRGTFPTARPRTGRAVRSTGSIEALEQWIGTQMEIVSPVALYRDPALADRLELDSSVVARLTVRRWVDTEPFALTEIVLPPELGNRLVSEGRVPEGRVPGTIVASVGDIAGPVTSAEETVTAIALPESAAVLLQTPAERPTLRVERLYRNSDGVPVEIAVTTYASERYEHRLLIHRAGSLNG